MTEIVSQNNCHHWPRPKTCTQQVTVSKWFAASSDRLSWWKKKGKNTEEARLADTLCQYWSCLLQEEPQNYANEANKDHKHERDTTSFLVYSLPQQLLHIISFMFKQIEDKWSITYRWITLRKYTIIKIYTNLVSWFSFTHRFGQRVNSPTFVGISVFNPVSLCW